MRIVLLVISVLLLCVPVSAQTWWVGPGDTVKIPLVLYDSINNPAAVDSAADSVLIRVIKNFAANSSGADTCYLHRGLLDASTNTLLHTTGNATTTLGFGQTPKRVQTFSFFATAYTLTNSATASGTYTIEVFTYDHSLNLITTRFYSMNYLYEAASTNTFAHWADSMILATRNTKPIADTVNAILDTLQVTDTRWDSTLAVFADANTLVKNRLLRIRDSVDNILDTLQLHDNWVAKEASVTIVRDTLALYDTRWDSLLAVVADANTQMKNRLLRIRDTVDNILDTLQLHDNWVSKEASTQIIRDTLALYDTRFDSLLAVVADANTLVKNRLLRIRDTVDALLDTLQLYDNWVKDSIHNQSVAVNTEVTKVKDTVNGIIDTLQLYDNWLRDSVHNQSVAVNTQVTKVIDTVNAIGDTLQNASSNLRASGSGLDSATTSRILGRKVWGIAAGSGSDSSTASQRVPTVVITDTLNAILDTLQLHDNWVRDSIHNQSVAVLALAASAANLTKVIDTVNAIEDSLQNGSSTLRGGGSSVDTALLNYYIRKGILGDTSKRIFSGLLSDTSKRVGFKGGSGDSVKVVGNVSTTVDTASLARSVWDDDIVSRANRTIDEVDTVYNTVICNDTVGGDFLLTLADYRAQIKHKMGIGQTNTTWLTDSVLNQLVREAIVTVNPIMRGYKTSITRVTRFDSSDYPLDSLVGISSVVWHKDDTARSIPYLAKEKWATLATQNTYGGDDPYLERPQVYDYTDAVISFFPVPTSEDTIQINGWAKIPNITVISAVSQIPQKYRVAVLKYASFLVARAKQHPLIQTYLDEYHESVAFLMAGNNVQAPSK